jgi:flagellar biosynthesis GTPase FlhF
MSWGAEIRAKMSLDSSGVKAGVDAAKNEVGGFKSSLGGLSGSLAKAFGAGAIVAGVKAFSKASLDMAARTKEVADQTGLTVDEMQSFNAAAMGTTGGIKAAEAGLVDFRNAQQEALDGNQTQIDAFNRLGVSIEDIATKSTPQLLEAVAKGYKTTGDFSALVDVFGKSNAPKLEEALGELADNGFGGLAEKAKAAGLALSEDMAAQLDATGDALDQLKLRAEVLWAKLLIGAYKKGSEIVAFWKGVWKNVTGEEGTDKSFGAHLSAGLDAMNQRKEELAAEDKKAVDSRRKTQERDTQARTQKFKSNEEKRAAEAAAKAEEKRAAEAAEKKADEELAKVAEKRLAEQQKASERSSADQETVPSVANLRGVGTGPSQQRFDSLREIGANVLGNGGRFGGASPDRQAELIKISRETAENTARLVQQATAYPVSRIGSPNPVF